MTLLRSRPGGVGTWKLCVVIFFGSGVLGLVVWGVLGSHGETLPFIDERYDALLSERGRYLARVGNCRGCHTAVGGEPYGGGVEFWASRSGPDEAIGVVYSTNISPHLESGIGGWTMAEFENALRRGVGPSGKQYNPAFPYQAFAGLQNADVAALYFYLMSVQPVESAPRKNQLRFPYNLSIGLRLWRVLFLRGGDFERNPEQSVQWNKGAYLVEHVAHCGACHTPRNLMFAEQSKRAYAGATYLDTFPDGNPRRWFAVNIAAGGTGLPGWSEADLATYLRTGHSPRARVFGPMGKVVESGTQYLEKADAEAMAAFLFSLSSKESTGGLRAAAAVEDTAASSGSRLYVEHCADCHGRSGRGSFFKAPPLDTSAIVGAEEPWSFINIIVHGSHAPSSLPPPFGTWEDMSQFGEKLSNEEIASVANFVRESFRGLAGQLVEADVAAQR